MRILTSSIPITDRPLDAPLPAAELTDFHVASCDVSLDSETASFPPSDDVTSAAPVDTVTSPTSVDDAAALDNGVSSASSDILSNDTADLSTDSTDVISATPRNDETSLPRLRRRGRTILPLTRNRRRRRTRCPNCLAMIAGNLTQLNEHANQCIDSATPSSPDDNDGSSPQSRHPPDVGLGGIVTLVGKTNSQNDVDEDIDVVTDDTMAFGRPQFTERDVERASGGFESADSMSIRDILLDRTGGGSTTMEPVALRRSRGRMNLLESEDEVEREENDDDEPPPPPPPRRERNLTIPAGSEIGRKRKKSAMNASKRRRVTTTTTTSTASTSPADATNSSPLPSSLLTTSLSRSSLKSSQSTQTEFVDDKSIEEQKETIEHLKTRIAQLESKLVLQSRDANTNGASKVVNDAPSSTRCIVCMDSYNTPLVSVGCWHVHCRNCWFSAMAQKKICPQCSAIVTPASLRRVFI